MKKVLAILLVCMSIICLLACGPQEKEFILEIDKENSRIDQITADLNLTDLVGEYKIYYADMENEVYPGMEAIMTVKGGETVHFEKLNIPAACFNLIIKNDNGDTYLVNIPMEYCTLSDEEL